MTEKDTEKKDIILIVDDNPKNIQVLGGILRKEYNLGIATDGKQAIEMVEKIHPDLILLDVMMPEMDGYEACGKIKKSEHSKIPIIFLTARTETEDIVKGFDVGAQDYVTKPFNTAELLARVHTHVELKKARDARESLIKDLENALSEVKQLSGLLPICSYCKKIRDDEGYWEQLEGYVSKRSEAQFSHGICPDCFDNVMDEIKELGGKK